MTDDQLSLLDLPAGRTARFDDDARLCTNCSARLGKSANRCPRCGNIGWTTPNMEAARAARDEGIARVDGNSEQEWREAVDRSIRWLAAKGGDFTADDIRHDARYFGEPQHPNAWGARFAAAARRGVIHRVGYRQSARPAGHARAVAVWRGVGK